VELRGQIADRKAEIIASLNSATTFSPPPISRRSATDPAPLSFAQERLWFLEQLEPDSVVYNVCRASRLIGDLNIPALEASLSEIVRRHEVLRSAIRVIDGRPSQATQSDFHLELPVVDLQNCANEERGAEVQRRIQEEALRPFDFAAGQFLRPVLLRTAENEQILVITTHHMMSDAWSMGILTRELWTLYEAFVSDRVSPLNDLPIQYSDFAAWQREWLRGEALESQLAYWKEQLAEIPILNLPADRPRAVRQSFCGARVPICLPESLTAAVNDLSYRFNVTPFMTLLAAFNVLLYRYSGQEDIVIGSPVANRRRSEVESLIGFFVNTLVLRTDLSGTPRFEELLSRVRATCLGAYAHQDLPFEKLVEELKPQRDTSRNPLFQVTLVLQNATGRGLEAPGIRAEPVETDGPRSQFDLSLFLRERNGKLIGSIEYSTDLFDRARIERMAGHLQRLLEAIVANPAQRISTLPLLTEKEEHRLLVEWNDTAADYPTDSCIHELFEAQVERTPEAVAARFEGKQLTYRELNHRTNQLAHYLRRLRVGPEKLVGICVERSLEMVVGLLGILKAGGAYVPLDPNYPRERLAFMLKDAEVDLLLTQKTILEDGRRPVFNESGYEIVCLDKNWEMIARESSQNPERRAGPKNLAYVIYTSGSTGRPKGVAIEHRNTVAMLQWAKGVFTGQELAGVLASTSICFDLSIFELFVPLSWGGKAILVENALHLESSPERDEVTLINTVPSVMVELLRAGRVPDSVRTVNLAGEPLRSELVEEIYACGHVDKVYDLYGPSETTTYSAFTLRVAEGHPTIGRPICNTRIYILDGNLQPVPMGITGELYIGGAGVGRGYLNRPDLTRDNFIPDTFSDQSTLRLYRTGDLARYWSDGNIELLGRADNQVKIRGYRIELGEIESVLNQHPAVKDGVIVARRDSFTEEHLIGYVVAGQPSVSLLTELRDYLREKLPHFMIPSSFVILDYFPLTPNGKIDRSALPAPEGSRAELIESFSEPRTEIEQLVAQTWREVLNAEKIGIHGNFFELGGHSLMAVQIVSRLRDAFNREIPLRAFFEAPTVARLTAKLENVIRAGEGRELPPIVRVPRNQPLPLSMNQEHLWHLDQMIPGTHFFNMPYVYHLRGDLNVGALGKTLREIVRRHEALRTVFVKVDRRPVQIIKDGTNFQLPVEDLRAEAADDASQRAAAVILEERERPFDLAAGPLLRTKLLCLKETEYLLLLTMHHIISDHWSVQTFRRELAVLYSAFSQGRPSPLPELPTQFADYASWERGLLEKGALDRQLDYWKKQLARPLPELELQKNKREQPLGFWTSRLPIDLDEALFADIKRLAQKENCTPFMVVVTALNIALYLYSGQHDIRIGTLVANRGRREIEMTIGHFLNTVILRTHISPTMTLGQLLKQVREVTVAAYAHQEFPFEQLARILEKEQEIRRPSLFGVLVNYQRGDGESDDKDGLSFAPLEIKQTEAGEKLTPTTFDLILNLRESSTKLTGTVNYRDDTFDRTAIASLTECFRSSLESIVLDMNRLTPQPQNRPESSPVTGGVLWHGAKPRP
jgi:amino acid adenylation domain-containing protein